MTLGAVDRGLQPTRRVVSDHDAPRAATHLTVDDHLSDVVDGKPYRDGLVAPWAL